MLINSVLRYLIDLWFLGYDFWNRNATKPIKCLKDLDSSLVPNKNFSEILPSYGWAWGQVTWAKMAENLFHLWWHSQKTRNQKNFFRCRLEDLSHLFKVWTALSTINWQVLELQTGVKIVAHVGFICLMYLYTGSEHVNWSSESCRDQCLVPLQHVLCLTSAPEI